MFAFSCHTWDLKRSPKSWCLGTLACLRCTHVYIMCFHDLTQLLMHDPGLFVVMGIVIVAFHAQSLWYMNRVKDVCLSQLWLDPIPEDRTWKCCHFSSRLRTARVYQLLQMMSYRHGQTWQTPKSSQKWQNSPAYWSYSRQSSGWNEWPSDTEWHSSHYSKTGATGTGSYDYDNSNSWCSTTWTAGYPAGSCSQDHSESEKNSDHPSCTVNLSTGTDSHDHDHGEAKWTSGHPSRDVKLGTGTGSHDLQSQLQKPLHSNYWHSTNWTAGYSWCDDNRSTGTDSYSQGHYESGRNSDHPSCNVNLSTGTGSHDHDHGESKWTSDHPACDNNFGTGSHGQDHFESESYQDDEDPPPWGGRRDWQHLKQWEPDHSLLIMNAGRKQLGKILRDFRENCPLERYVLTLDDRYMRAALLSVSHAARKNARKHFRLLNHWQQDTEVEFTKLAIRRFREKETQKVLLTNPNKLLHWRCDFEGTLHFPKLAGVSVNVRFHCDDCGALSTDLQWPTIKTETKTKMAECSRGSSSSKHFWIPGDFPTHLLKWGLENDIQYKVSRLEGNLLTTRGGHAGTRELLVHWCNSRGILASAIR